eukprot:sb/3470131/
MLQCVTTCYCTHVSNTKNRRGTPRANLATRERGAEGVQVLYFLLPPPPCLNPALNMIGAPDNGCEYTRVILQEEHPPPPFSSSTLRLDRRFRYRFIFHSYFGWQATYSQETVVVNGWYISSYALAIFHLNLFIAFLSPKIDPMFDMAESMVARSNTNLFQHFIPQGWYISSYALAIFHLNLFIAFLSPKIDPMFDMAESMGKKFYNYVIDS